MAAAPAVPKPDLILGRASLNEREAFRNFIEAMRVAESCARQIALARNAPQWILVGAALEGVREKATELAQKRSVPLEHRFLS